MAQASGKRSSAVRRKAGDVGLGGAGAYNERRKPISFLLSGINKADDIERVSYNIVWHCAWNTEATNYHLLSICSSPESPVLFSAMPWIAVKKENRNLFVSKPLSVKHNI